MTWHYPAVGWFGVPGETRRRTQTHLVDVAGGVPVCGSRISERAEFQWCSADNYEPECRHCVRVSRARRVAKEGKAKP